MTAFSFDDLAFMAAGQGPADPDFSSVSLLLHGNGTNGSTTITDSSLSPKTVTTVGNARISTEQSKFGGASIYFAPQASSLRVSPYPGTDAGTFLGDFTVEFWYYPTNANNPKGGVGQGLFDTRAQSSPGGANGFIIYNASSTSSIVLYTSGANRIISTTTIANGNWYHIALTRSSGIMRLFINGTQEGGNYGNTNSFTDTYVLISGVNDNTGGTYMMFEGYLDELRITKGVARYTTNFTPPTASFPDF